MMEKNMSGEGINALFEKIDTMEREILKKFPKQKGRVKIANAKTNADYEAKEGDEYHWAHIYHKELQRQFE